jgi:hypothetical protein
MMEDFKIVCWRLRMDLLFAALRSSHDVPRLSVLLSIAEVNDSRRSLLESVSRQKLPPTSFGSTFNYDIRTRARTISLGCIQSCYVEHTIAHAKSRDIQGN